MPEEQKEFTRRTPYLPVKIGKLKETQGRVAVLGAVISKDAENFTFMLDDGSGQVLAVTNDMTSFSNVAEGKLVRVLGKTMGQGEETEILADIIQDFSKIDKERYNKYIINQ